MSRRPIQILDNTVGLVNVIGQPVKAAGYFGSTRGVHTVAIYLHNFTGRVFIEATIANQPEENDWFPIYLNGVNPYAQYPVDPMNLMGPSVGNTGDTGVDSFTFEGNFTYIRARQNRDYLPTPSDPTLGSLGKILLSF